MLRRGRGGVVVRGYVLFLHYAVMCIAHQQRWVIRCISIQGLSFKYIALCIPKFTIYLKTIIKGNVGLGILAFLNMYIV